MPRVTLLLLIGVLVGPSGLALVPQSVTGYFPLTAQLALSIIGFLLGEQFLGKKLESTGPVVLAVSIAETLGAALLVLIGLLLVGAPPALALLLAGIAPASAPAATVDVVRESHASGPLTNTVLEVVAIDDAYGIMLFSALLILAEAFSGGVPSWSILLSGCWEIVGAALLGIVLGVPMAWLTGRVRAGELTLVETLGFVFACAGLAEAIGVSYLLACVVLGAVVANRARHHTRPFHAIEGISQPFLIIFFVMAGFELDLGSLGSFGLIAVTYVIGRAVGLIAGGSLGARISGAPHVTRRFVGWCLLPQAGVALGLALVAGNRFPDLAPGLLSLVVATTVFFEVLGPIATRIALRRAGEAGGGAREA